jgi:hypothetical protein
MIPEAAGDAGNVRSVKVVRPTNIAEAVRFALAAADEAAAKGSVAEVRSSM